MTAKADTNGQNESAELADLREQGTLVGLLVVYAAGLLLTFCENVLAEGPVHVWLPVGVLLLAGAILALLRLSPLAARALIVTGSAALTFLVVHPGGVSIAAPLLAVSVLLAGVLFPANVSLLVAGLATALVAILPAGQLPLSGVERVVTLLAIWGAAGLQRLMLHQLLWSVRWAWDGYRQSRASLEHARDLQVRIYETMEDLTSANAQLTRLNDLANSLRETAENERQAKQQFVANVSHELRTPLNMIIGFCEMITQTPHTYGSLPPKLLPDLSVVLRNSQHLSALINDILDLSQVEAGMLALSKERCSLAEIVESAVLAIQPLFRSKQLYLDVEVPDDLPSLYCDRTRIREVVLNLLSNAGRFTEQGGCTVRVVLQGNDLALSVSDTGPGIAPRDQERLFRPFEQIDGTLRRRYGGTGLGLSISKSFVDLHGGRMSLESAPGKGTTIQVSLPIELPGASTSGALRWFNPHRPYEERTRPVRFRPSDVRARLVVVEEGNALTRLLDRYMNEVEVVSVANMQEACQQTAQNPAQAVLINDLDVGRVLRSLGSKEALPPRVPVMVCAVPAVEYAASIPGVSAYLIKPISRVQLLATLAALPQSVHKLLVIDDDPDALHLLRRMLASAKRGYQVSRASSATRGLELLFDERPDAVLLDLAIPDVDGFAFLKTKAADPTVKDIPVILVTARDPSGQPIVSSALAVTTDRGLSAGRLLSAIGALVDILSPTAGREPARKAVPPG